MAKSIDKTSNRRSNTPIITTNNKHHKVRSIFCYQILYFSMYLLVNIEYRREWSTTIAICFMFLFWFYRLLLSEKQTNFQRLAKARPTTETCCWNVPLWSQARAKANWPEHPQVCCIAKWIFMNIFCVIYVHFCCSCFVFIYSLFINVELDGHYRIF